MGRIIKVGSGPPIPAGNTNMTFRMTKLGERPVECPECVVSVEGLYWQDEVTEEFDISADITEYNEHTGEGGMWTTMHFWMHAAKLVGELCDEEVVWETVWSGLGTGPIVWTDGPYCIVYPPMSDIERAFLELREGTLSVTATVKGVSYGPINLIIEEEPY